MGLMQRLADMLPRRRALTNLGNGTRAYDAGRHDLPQMASWNPSLSHPDDEALQTRDVIVARARDLSRNHPVISGAVDRRTEAVVGPDIRLEAQPNFEAMNRTADWADDWSTAVEAQWSVWANDNRKLCDASRIMHFGGIVEVAYRHWMVDGEAGAAIKMLPRGGRYQTAVQLIDPDRISNPDGKPEGHKLPNGNRLYGGVEVDANGAPVAYYVRVRHPAAVDSDADRFTWTRIAREGRTGRPLFVHAYRPGRAEQRRGVSRLASAIKLTRIGDKLDLATLDAAVLNAFMAISVESPYPTADVRDAMAPTGDGNPEWSLADQVAYRQQNRVAFPSGPTVRHFLPGEHAEALAPEYPNGNYPEFEAALLRKISAAIGLSYPQLSQNWADINYSSARTLLNEIWRSLLHDRALFTQAFCTPIYAAWLEEAVAIGAVKVPGGPLNFYKWRAELTVCEWMGPGRGTIDPLKEASAADIDMNAGRSNLAIEAAKQGLDHRKVLLGAARDKKLRERLGLEPFVPMKGSANQAGIGDGNDEETRDPNGKFSPNKRTAPEKKEPEDAQ